MKFLALLFTLVAHCLVSAPGRAEESPAADVIDLILVAGQSNAVGFDAHATDLPADPDDKDILFWWRCGDPPPDAHDSTSGSRAWIHLQPQPVGDPKPKNLGARQYGNFSQPDGGFGPEIGLARHLDEAQPARRLAIVKAAFSGTGISRDWNPKDKTGATGACYRALIEEVEAALAAAEKSGKKMRLRAFVWVQGESDANPADLPHYEATLRELIASIRSEFERPDMKALVAVNTQFGGGANDFMPKVIEAQKAVAHADPLCAYVDTSKASVANKYHFDTRGTLDVGKWFAEALIALEK